MKKHTIIITVILVCLSLGINIGSHAAIKKCRKELQFKFTSPSFHLPANFAKIVAGEFKGLAADYLLMEVGSFIGSNQEMELEDLDNITQALKQSLELDPYFQQTYMYVQGNLPWFDDMTSKTNELLDISSRHRPWDWRPKYYMGFNYYYFLSDYTNASKIFLDASKIENAPVLLAVLGSRFAHKSNRTEAAIDLLRPMIEDPNLDDNSKKEIKNRLIALKGVTLLENAIKQYQTQHNALPSSLDLLVDQGLIDQIPPNPYIDSYVYDAETGQVFFDKIH